MVGVQRLKVCDNWAQLCAGDGGAWELMARAFYSCALKVQSVRAQELLARLTAPAHYTAIDDRPKQKEHTRRRRRRRSARKYNFPPCVCIVLQRRQRRGLFTEVRRGKVLIVLLFSLFYLALAANNKLLMKAAAFSPFKGNMKRNPRKLVSLKN